MIEILTKTVKRHFVGDEEFKTVSEAQVAAIVKLADGPTPILNLDWPKWIVDNAASLCAILKTRKPRAPKPKVGRPKGSKKAATVEQPAAS